MYFPDLGTETQICSAPFVRAVGWLDDAHPFTAGPTPVGFRSRLAFFARRWGDSTTNLRWPAAGGGHQCQYCGECVTSGNFGVIAGDLLYVCPEMVAHYVSEHDYLPPDAFRSALVTCDMPWSARYVKAAQAFWL